MTKRPVGSHAFHIGRRAASLLVVVSVAACAGSDTSTDVDLEQPDATTATTRTPPAPTGTDATRGTTGDTGDTGDPTVSASSAPAATRCAPADASDASSEPTTIRIWHSFDGDVVAFFDEVIAEFESEHPGIDVESTRYEGATPRASRNWP